VDNRAIQLALSIIRQSSRTRPADAVLRETLKQQRGLAPDSSRKTARTVFDWFRWRGWFDGAEADEIRLAEAQALQERFDRDPGSFSDEEIEARATPGWVHEEVPVKPGWKRALQCKPRTWLRARPGTAAQVARQLNDCRLSKPVTDALEYSGREDLFCTELFQAGAFEIQDINSQVVGLVCNAQPGETWWDACAGEGGKTLHLSALMRNKGLIWASDRAEWRLSRLKRRAARAQVFNYRAAPWDGGPALPTRTVFDGVLLDAPCTGLGTWNRNPHARWTTTPEDVRELAAAQQRLLACIVPSLKPGGRLIYAVCTLTRNETEGVAAEFERSFPEMEPLPFRNPQAIHETEEARVWLWPQETDGSGMFIAAWRRRPD
jgi:16S rRNA (cytosine967-C5)-methyltransferase